MGPQGEEPAARLLAGGGVGDRKSGERFGLRQVGSDQQRLGQDAVGQRAAGVLPEQRRAALGHHHRVHHELLHRVFVEAARHFQDDFGGEEHARLRGVGPDVGEDGAHLRAHHLGGQRVDGLHAQGVLRRDRGHRRRAVAAEHREGPEIRLDARAAAGVGTGDGEHFLHRFGHRFFLAGC